MRRGLRIRRITLMILLLAIVMADAGLAMAEKKSQRWVNGVWVEGSYVNDKGETLATLEEADKKPLPKIKNNSDYKILYIGASRTKNMKKAVKDNKVFFYYAGGKGFKWLFNSCGKGKKKRYPAYLVIRSFLNANPKRTVIIDLGGNDLHNLSAYIGFYKDLLKNYPDTTFYFMGVLPRSKGNISNPVRRMFDMRLETEFPDNTINLFDKVYKLKGFKTVDGTHYGKRQNRIVYQMVMNAIGRKVKVNLNTGKVTAR